MQIPYNKHKAPIAITSVGLIAAIGLAVAPIIMADSETDKLAKKNASEIQKLATTVDDSASGVQEQIASSLGDLQSTVGTLESQILILNKAATQLNLRQRKLQEQLESPSEAIQSSIDQLAYNSDGRLVNLEKAVTRLHKKQQSILEPSGPVQARISQLDNNASGRLVNLEKAVTQLHRRQREAASSMVDTNTQIPEADIQRLEERLISLENTIDSTTIVSESEQSDNLPSTNVEEGDYEWRIASLERTVREMALDQRVNTTTENSRLLNLAKTDIQTGIQLREFEQLLSQLDSRLNDIESMQSQVGTPLSQNTRSNQPDNTRLINNRNIREFNSNPRDQGNYQTYDPVIDRLEDLRGTLDALLSEMAR